MGHLCSTAEATSTRCPSTGICLLPTPPLAEFWGPLGNTCHSPRGKCRETPFPSSGCDLCTHINLGPVGRWSPRTKGEGGGKPEGRERGKGREVEMDLEGAKETV